MNDDVFDNICGVDRCMVAEDAKKRLKLIDNTIGRDAFYDAHCNLDGRGTDLNIIDGCEYCIKINDTNYYIYRQM